MKRISLTSSFYAFLPVVFAYRLLLDYGYFHVIARRYAYNGFHDNRTELGLMISWVVLLLSYAVVRSVLQSKDNRDSVLIVSLLYLLSFVPFTTCIYAGILDSGYIVSNCVYWLVLLFGEIISLSVPVRRLPHLRIGRVSINDKFVWIAGWLSMLLVVFISGRYAHFRLSFNLFSVYDIRLEARDYHFPRIISYMFAWTRAINPILFAYSLLKRNRGMGILFFLTQMLSFGIDGLKSTFFMPFLVLVVMVLYNRISARKFKFYLLCGLTALTIIAVLEYALLRSHLVIELIIRRVMFVPNYLSNCYYDFFQNNVPDYFRSSFLRFFGFQSPYTTDSRGITYIIGQLYFNRASMNCNNGLVSDALTNLGKPGLVLMPIILVLVLRLFDRSTMHLDKRISAASTLYLANTMINTFLMPVLLTHGMLVLILLFSMIDEEELQGYEKNCITK